jgi:hypothetical protein
MLFKKFCIRGLLALVMSVSPQLLLAEEAPEQEVTRSVRAAAVLVQAEIVAIDLETREVSLKGPLGQILTMTADKDIERLEEFAVGDIISATYLTSLAGELREPTEEEKANPWQVMEAAEIADGEQAPGVAGARMIHAVCTIEGMNRVLRTVMVEDPRGKYHVIEDVDPARLEGLTLGTSLILTYTEAVALSLEKRPLEAE